MENLIYRGAREPENVGKKSIRVLSGRVSEEFRNLIINFRVSQEFRILEL